MLPPSSSFANYLPGTKGLASRFRSLRNGLAFRGNTRFRCWSFWIGNTSRGGMGTRGWCCKSCSGDGRLLMRAALLLRSLGEPLPAGHGSEWAFVANEAFKLGRRKRSTCASEIAVPATSTAGLARHGSTTRRHRAAAVRAAGDLERRDTDSNPGVCVPRLEALWFRARLAARALLKPPRHGLTPPPASC